MQNTGIKPVDFCHKHNLMWNQIMAKNIKISSEIAEKFKTLSDYYLCDEDELITSLIKALKYDETAKAAIKNDSIEIIKSLRNSNKTLSLIDKLLQEYGLSSKEGIILMRLSEALVRTKDAATAKMLIRDKISQGDWAAHAGKSQSILINRATQALQLLAFWIKVSGGKNVNNIFAKAGDIITHKAMALAMKLMGRHFVLGETIDRAIAKSQSFDHKITCFSYDMLGEAAYTNDDAQRYFSAYEHAVLAIANDGPYTDIRQAPNISIKLSALHPRYESSQAEQCITPIYEKLLKLCTLAKDCNFGITIDAEECERLEISLLIIEKLCANDNLRDWDGLSIVVQAYQKRALSTIEFIAVMGRQYDRKLMIRLVKGAYWDSEIKRAQEMGLSDYPVFTRKENSDLNYIFCAQKIIENADIIYPQFATHNAQSAAAVAYYAQKNDVPFEFQRLFGMGDELHILLAQKYGVKSRIYAPVGPHRDLLPYLVRRLLENGANSSFVNQLSNENIDANTLTYDPLDRVQSSTNHKNPNIPSPVKHLENGRISAAGFDETQFDQILHAENNLSKLPFIEAYPIINGKAIKKHPVNRFCPFDRDIMIGKAHYADIKQVQKAIDCAAQSQYQYDYNPKKRADIVRRIGDTLLASQNELIALLVWEAGKTVNDALSEIREAVDFCRYYADQAETHIDRKALGTIACISPWNFPLAIYLGQIVAALSMGNCVIAKPAEQTPLIAYKINDILFRSGIPKDAFHLLIGDGALLGNAITSSDKVDAICFTGSTKTAKLIAQNLSNTGRANIPFIAETGGINAMIVDSTALLEQVIEDVIASAFQSAGQRCSACRLLCIQEDIADECLTMLRGAMAALQIGKPTSLSTDIGPVIDQNAQKMINDYSSAMQKSAHNVGAMPIADDLSKGSFVIPYAFEIDNISSLEREIFGPVLHIKRFKASEIDSLITEINALGYGLTMGLHTRIDARIEHFSKHAKVGNLYVNRNQIGAVVGVQPFGGEGLSGTGPKAGGPYYLKRLSQNIQHQKEINDKADQIFNGIDIEFLLSLANEQSEPLLRQLHDHYISENPMIADIYKDSWIKASELLKEYKLPGPTGENNILRLYPRGVILCMGGDNIYDVHHQIMAALSMGNNITIISDTNVSAKNSRINNIASNAIEAHLQKYNAIAVDGIKQTKIAAKIAQLEGAIIPILSGYDDIERYAIERCVTIDTTSAGGNASLLALN